MKVSDFITPQRGEAHSIFGSYYADCSLAREMPPSVIFKLVAVEDKVCYFEYICGDNPYIMESKGKYKGLYGFDATRYSEWVIVKLRG